MSAEIEAQINRFKRLKELSLKAVRERVPASTVPEGTKGPWTVQRTNINLPGMAAARSLVKGERGWTPPGQYTLLVHDIDGVVMSDTLDECEDLLPIIMAAKGTVLVTGLGLGVAADALLRKPEVSRVTVLEKNTRVIQLIGPHLMDLHGDALEIIKGDAFTWEPVGRKWDWAWHDIWNILDHRLVRDLAILRTRFRTNVRVRQLGWCERLAERYGA